MSDHDGADYPVLLVNPSTVVYLIELSDQRLLLGGHIRKAASVFVISLLFSGRYMKPAPVKPIISVEVLDKVDVRIGTIDRVESLDRSRTLVKLTVDFGDHKRTILVGMKQERDDPREILGKQALFIVNLEPRSMMGETSQGMLFDIGHADGIVPVLALPERPVPNGARAG